MKKVKSSADYIKSFDGLGFIKFLDKFDVLEFSRFKALFLEGLLDTHLAQPFDKKRRERRDHFVEFVVQSLQERGLSAAAEWLGEACANTAKVEQLFDSLLEEHTKDISPDLECADFVWGLLKVTEGELYHVAELQNDRLDEVFDSIETRDALVIQAGFSIPTLDNRQVNAGSAIEGALGALVYGLKKFAHQYRLMDHGKIVIPEEIPISLESYAQGHREFLGAGSWANLENVATKLVFFGGTLSTSTSTRDRIDDLVTARFGEVDIRRNDFTAFSRLELKYTQNVMEITSDPSVRLAFANEVVPVGSLRAHEFSALHELVAYEVLRQFLRIDPLSDTKLYGGAYLIEWLRGYSALLNLCKAAPDQRFFSYSQVREALLGAHVRSNVVSIVIDQFTLRMDSRDYYDSPLVAVSDGSFYVLPRALESAHVALVLLSLLSSFGANLERKGAGFEQYVLELLKRRGQVCCDLEFRINRETYQYDVVLVIGDKIFVLECKNTNPSSNQPKLVYSFAKKMADAEIQVRRLACALMENLSELEEKLNISFDRESVEVVPVVLNNFPYSRVGSSELGVYFSDISTFSRFFLSKSITSRPLDGSGEDVPIHEMWSGDQPCAEDLVRHLESPLQLQWILPFIREHELVIPCGDSGSVLYPYFDLDREQYHEYLKRLAT